MSIRLFPALAALAVTGIVDAAPRAPTTQRGVDVVTLADGTRVLGVVTHRDKSRLVIAVRRAWLAEALPERLERHTRDLDRADDLRRRRALDRVDAWRAARRDQPALVEFLDQEAERLATIDGAEKPPRDENAVAKSEFLLLTISAEELRRVYVQPAARRNVALVAWRERLENVEQRRTDELARALRRSGIAIPDRPVDLSDRLPTNARTTDVPWEARIAAVEYRLVEPLDFQGTGDVLLRTNGDADENPGVAEVLSAFTKNLQPGALLGLNPAPVQAPATPRPMNEFATAIREAERLGANGFRVTRVEPQLAAQRVRVETLFVAKLGRGWQPVWRHETTVNAGKRRPELEKRIEADDRIGKLFETIRALGVGEAPLTTAVRFGAATMEAQTTADSAFFDFTEAAGRSLDGAWPASTPAPR